MIAGNYQREIEKRSIGISLKTIFSVLAFLSSKNKEHDIEKRFNRLGDLGLLAQEFLSGLKQGSLQNKELTLQDITLSFEKISKTKGKNSSKIKEEILGKLFLSTTQKSEQKFLARVLIDDYRIGVSSGVLREACVHALFPKILGIHLVCSNCSYINLNTPNCFSCKEKLNTKEQEKIVSENYKIKEEEKTLEKSLKHISNEEFIQAREARTLFNELLALFEKKYNLLNSFRTVLSELKEDPPSLFKAEIKVAQALTSMLGTRANSSSEALKMTGDKVLADFKYDGLRLQIHNNKGEIKLFSRNLEDTTKQFPEVLQFIKENFSDLSFVIDSECVGYNYETLRFLPFQELSRRILTKKQDSVSHIKIVIRAFDLLYLNGKTLIDEPYEERRKLLEGLFLNRELKEPINIDTEKIKELLINSKES
jgi:DNA ligase-1